MHYTQALHRATQLFPHKAAVKCGDRSFTFREFGDRVARLAGALQAQGLQDGDSVAILSLNSDRFLEYTMAVPWAGGVLNPCNIRWSGPEIVYSLNDAESKFLLVDDTFLPLAQKIRADARTVKTWIYCGDKAAPPDMLDYETLVKQARPVPDAMRQGDDLMGVFYTGGTTGFPKGVMVSHAGVGAGALGLLGERAAAPDGVYLHSAPMFHGADLTVGGAHWLLGNTQAIIPAFNPEAVVDAIERHRVTHGVLVPTMIQMLVDHPVMKQGRDLSSLQMVIYGGSPISEAVLDRAMAALPGVQFLQAYGMTELFPLATCLPPEYHTPEGRKLGKLRSAGRASCITEVRVVDPEGIEVPRGTVGEIIVHGPNVMKGYWRKPEQTAEAVRDGWMHTGDGAYMDEDGFIFVVDRIKDMIVTGGENVYSAEVEQAVAQHPAVAASAVIGIPSEQWGESVHACVVLRPGQAATEEELVAHCKNLIANYKCPRSISFVEALPLSGAGKVLKTKLREPYWQGQSRRVG
ncbi:fatty-acid--CoA ligase [Variovorax sp. KBW07]|uniref:long-chain-fatty-acid--CoA ligase n=1 Tax=Variovorax sp. KBW07 TaxID=2153358 RepID=UPI000F55F81D|nr:long-chain-fatty-acid--CoA ligase [Variovorax sp. KBW07]RQO61083.1 fatty-acid--CoA ligase [Variovorax sp. KBW07]